MNQSRIAEKLGISQSSVSLVLRNPATTRVSEKTKERIIQCLKDSNYMTPSGRIRRWNIGYVTDTFQNIHQDFFRESLRGIDEESARNHYNLIMECLRGRSLNLLSDDKVDGLIVRSGKVYEFLQKNGVTLPIVLLNCASPVTRCDSVMPDNRSGMHKVVDHLHAQGAEKILFISCKSDYSPYSCNYQEREFYFIEACSCRNIRYSVEYVPAPSVSPEKITAQIRKLVRKWQKEGTPGNIVTVNHYYACLIRQLYSEAVVIAGDNKSEDSAAGADFPMLIQDAACMGKMATELLLKRIAEPNRRHVRINCDMELFIPEKNK